MKLKIRPKLFLLALVVPLLLGLLVVFIFFVWYLSSFAKEVGLSRKDVVVQLLDGFNNPYQKKYLSFLILGLDQRPGESSLLTDTILLATVNTQSGNYLLFSLPRDLWLDDLKTKINALYYYGQKKNPEDETYLVKERIEEILGWRIDYVILLRMEQIKDLVNLLGGVEVEVERSFVDEEYPRDDGSGGVMRVEFKKGRWVFDGEKALQFMRSRKSKDKVEGTDEARQKRQKKVILALKEKVVWNKNLWLNPKKAAELYKFFTDEIVISPSLDIKTIVSFWRVGLRVAKGGKEREAEIPWRGEGAILVDDRDPLYNSWILRPRGNNWELIREYFADEIKKLD